MTRINIIPVKQLYDQHLIAEYREITMVPASLNRTLNSKLGLNKNKIPERYTLNKGHVYFFYDKGKYIYKRYFDIINEMIKRGFDPDPYRLFPPKVFIDNNLFNDWKPITGDYDIINHRLEVKLQKRPNWYKKTDHKTTKEINTTNQIYISENYLDNKHKDEFKLVKTMHDLYDYHGKHKYLFMTIDQIITKKMGRISANVLNNEINQVKKHYSKELDNLLKIKPQHSSFINVHMHIIGYFKNDLPQIEKQFFFQLLDDFKNYKISLYSINKILFSFAKRFEKKYLLKQSFFKPFNET